MYKIMLVDDDYLVLEYLTQMVPWEKLGFSISGKFQDGEQALTYIKSEMVDLVITDIGMPIMDGINLIRHIKGLNPNIYSVILSCHDDFTYAQQALKLDAYDYILKESMESDKIINLLIKLKEKLDREKEMKNQMEILKKKNLLTLKSRFLDWVLENKQDEESIWKKQEGSEIGLDINFSICIPVICFIDRYEEIRNVYSSDEILKLRIDNIVSDTLKGTRKNFSIFYKESMFFIFYSDSYFMVNNHNHFQEVAKSIKEILHSLQDKMNISITSIVGNECKITEGIREQLKMMINMAEQRFYMEDASIVKLEKLSYSSENIFIYYANAFEELRTQMVQRNTYGIENTIHKWVTFINEHKFHPNTVREWMLKLLLDLSLKFNSIQNFEPKYSISVAEDFITKAETIFQIEETLKSALIKIIKKIEDIDKVSRRTEIVKAQNYVLMNLDKKISLKDVANYLYLHPSYFSRLYKKDTNENFIDFVIKSKMERAKELIDSSNVTMGEISEMLGFDSKSYFFKTFKKQFGISPTEYKFYALDGETNLDSKADALKKR
ncbi:hypothetical protein CWR48_02835 [Oceanobacillus arenosus]|uniref:DNA-binding response regulator n=1 Tax=Oceanobacillus arenosus TaxID=1229153 RepID=A0A3D8Q180_9BACI|nr:response regulator [Oceanobacillus arenosus]RDW21358.1 hypothetical protein CWR48_02835 [Oceanobacillus arenosus]